MSLIRKQPRASRNIFSRDIREEMAGLSVPCLCMPYRVVSLVVALLLALLGGGAYGAEIKSVYLVSARGSTYEVTEVHAIKRDKVPKLTALKNVALLRWTNGRVRGAKYWAYETLEKDGKPGLPVRLNKAEYLDNKAALAQVPDNRPWDVAHPNWEGGRKIGMAGLNIGQYFVR